MTTVVAGVLERDGLVLIAQRKPVGQHPLKWEFPGGKVEHSGVSEQALARELHEELGIRARVQGEILRYQYSYPERPAILLIFYRVADFGGEPRNLDFAQIRWESAERLRDYDFLEGDAEFIRNYSADG